MSSGRPSAFTPCAAVSSSAKAWFLAASRLAMITVAPHSASPREIWLPSSPAPPETNATRPERSNSLVIDGESATLLSRVEAAVKGIGDFQVGHGIDVERAFGWH